VPGVFWVLTIPTPSKAVRILLKSNEEEVLLLPENMSGVPPVGLILGCVILVRFLVACGVLARSGFYRQTKSGTVLCCASKPGEDPLVSLSISGEMLVVACFSV